MKEKIFVILNSLKNVVRVAAFLLLAAFLLNTWIVWFKPKHLDGNLMMETYYSQPEGSVDVLVVGSSHTFVDVNTGVLWDDYGLPSFVIGGSLQPFSSSYYYIKEAVKTQTPDLIILEALACNIDDDYSNPGILFNNSYGLRWGWDKIETMRSNVHNTDELVQRGLFFEDYHNRYAELDFGDIAEDYGDPTRMSSWKGFYDYFLTYGISEPEYEDDVVPVPIPNKEEFYYRRIIEFCQENEIPLMIMVSPDGGYDDLQRAHYLYAEQIAQEYGVDFVDFNEYYDEMHLNFDRDFADIGHLNHIGNRKFTEVLGDYLNDNYDLEDRRDDETGLYDSWNDNSLVLESRYNNYMLRDTSYAVDYLERLSDLSDDYKIFITVSDITYVSDELRQYLGLHDISCQRPFDSRRYMICGDLTTVFEADDNGLYYEEFSGEHHLTVCLSGTYFDSERLNVIPGHDGVEFVVFDEYNQTIADAGIIVGDEVWRS